MNKTQATEIKRTLMEGRAKFARLITALDEEQVDSGARLLLDSWQSFIDSDQDIERLSAVDGFQSICGIGSKLSAKQTYDELLSTAASCFAEIDMAVHLIRERRGSRVKKLPEVSGSKQADFEVSANLPLFVEAKYVLVPSPRKLEGVVAGAVEQIIHTGRQKSYAHYDGVVWIFSYQWPKDMNNVQLQDLITRLAETLHSQVPGELSVTFQIYGQGVYGDATL